MADRDRLKFLHKQASLQLQEGSSMRDFESSTSFLKSRRHLESDNEEFLAHEEAFLEPQLRRNRQSSCPDIGERIRLPSFEEKRALSDVGNYSSLVLPYFTDISKVLKFGLELGRGASGLVRQCAIPYEKAIYACKSISKANLRERQDIASLKYEARALLELQQEPGVLKLRGIYEDKNDVHFVTELCEGGDLFNRIKERRFFTEHEAASICKTLATVIHVAHERGIMHRDIKPENVLLVSKYDDTDVRLADFGSVAFFKPGQKLTQFVGSSLYMAPSVLDGKYGPEIDLWSLGVVLHVLLSGLPPFKGASNREVFQNIRNGRLDLETRRWKYVSEEAKSLVRGLLERDDSKRLTSIEVLEHKWIKNPCLSHKDTEMDIPIAEALHNLHF